MNKTNELLRPSITINDLLTKTDGHLVNHNHSDQNLSIYGISALDETLPDTVSFYADKSTIKLIDILPGLKCSVLLIDQGITTDQLSTVNKPVMIKVHNPYQKFLRLIPVFYPPIKNEGYIDPLASIDSTASLGKDVRIGAFCVIGKNVQIANNTRIMSHVVIYDDVNIGSNCHIHAGVIIRERCTIGDNSTIECGAIIGSDGFGYYPDDQKGLVKIPQVGTVKVGNHVDVGANTCIDRATIGTTLVENGSKIDNLVQIGHNNKIGKNVILCGQVGIAGSCQIGDGAVLGGATKVADHIKIKQHSRFGGGTLVRTDIIESGDYAGDGPLPKRQWLKVTALLKKLPEIISKQRGH